MKTILLIACALLYLNSNAQTYPDWWPVAISDSGLLVGKHVYEKKNGSSYNTLVDTVSIKVVQSIQSIQGVFIDFKAREIYSLKAAEFEMALKSDTTRWHSYSAKLTDEMKAKLNKLSPGDIVFFQFIRLEGENDFDAMTTPLFFYLK